MPVQVTSRLSNDHTVSGAWRNREVLVTGASGFIGRHLVSELIDGGASVRAMMRNGTSIDRKNKFLMKNIATVRGDLRKPLTLTGVCKGIDTVFHLAGYAHAADGKDPRGDEIHWQVTVDGTRGLLRDAVGSGVQRFVFVSTVKAMGEDTHGCVDESSPVNPVSGYGRAKLAAERLVLEAGKEFGIHVVILRLPIVYGFDNRGNIPRMIGAIDRGRFPPLPEVDNRRSMVHVHDVVQALLLAATHDVANGQIYLVTDGQRYSTRQIELQVRAALGKPIPRWTIPRHILQIAACVGDLVGKLLHRQLPLDRDVLRKLLGSACYDSSKIEREIGFRPRYRLSDALPEMIEQYRDRHTMSIR